MSDNDSKTAYDYAEQLLQTANSEEGYRAAASRAFQAARSHIMQHSDVKGKISLAGKASDHGLLFDFLKNSSKTHLVKACAQLRRLRILRNRADYNLDDPFTKGHAEDALERAADIIFEILQ